ncbi:hypothetical protein HHI36_012145 [Cryptolaemus montrouzieri]|uniref:FAT domain-containing protein n=1 Tax=Cryptolaemus montrouzieri TaxID=559131 RepID=A0ABD2NDE9_9CUCU
MLQNFLESCSKFNSRSTLQFEDAEINFYSSVLELTLKTEDNFMSFIDVLYIPDEVKQEDKGLEFIELLTSLKRSEFVTNSLSSLILRAGDHVVSQESLDFKIEVFKQFLESVDPSNENLDCTPIREGLNELLKTIANNTDKNARGIMIIKLSKLFQAMHNTRSPILFEFIIKSYLEFIETEELIKDSVIFRKYLMNIGERLQEESMEILFSLVRNSQYPLVRRNMLGKLILTTVFQNVNIEVFESFYANHIKSIVDELEEKLSEDNMEAKMVNFLLVEILFARLPIGEDNEINKRMLLAAFGEDRPVKELLRSFLKYSLGAFRDNIAVNSKKQDVFRLYRCYSYNALVSIAVNSLHDENFYLKLFTRLENGEDILWKAMMDPSKTYKFEKDFNILPQKKKQLVNIRNKLNAECQIYSKGETIRSQRIFNSSLSEDITKYDMSNVRVRTEAIQTDNKADLAEIELDYIDVNDHECMPTICGLINYLGNTNIVIAKGDEIAEDIPECFKALRYILLHETTPVNVKIFLIKVIENTSHVFIYYSKWFLAPVMKFIVEKCAGDEMNFFITDLIVMLANWSDKAVPEDENEKDLATKLIKFLFEKLSIDRKDVFKYNLELIRVLLQAWKGNILIPNDFLQRIEISADFSKEIEIHLSSLLLINDIFVFDNGNESLFLKFLTMQLNSSKRSCYIPCSETLGLLLKKWDAKGVITTYSNTVEPALRKIWDSDTEKGSYIMEGITLHYPDFIKEHHIVRILSRLKTVSTSCQHVLLKTMLRAVPVLENVGEYRIEAWETYINSESAEIQITTLHLMKETFNILDEKTFQNIITAICEKRNSQIELCKKLVFDILIKICSGHFEDSAKFVRVEKLCRDSLLDGLNVEDPELLDSIRSFWTTSEILSKSLIERFLQTLSIFYKPRNENVLLGSSIYFLLSLLKNTQDFDETLFEHPLEDCQFEDYELSVTASIQHPYAVPMFAETFLDTFTNKTSIKPIGEIRATQDELNFSPTVPSRQDEALSQLVSSQSQLLLNIQDEDNLFKNPNELSMSQCKVIRRRFLRDKTKISDHCANVAVKGLVRKVEDRTSRAKERDRRVCISRKYRKGDFPDVQIPFSSIAVPLQMLATENSDIAKTVYTQIFKSIKNKLEESHWSHLSETIASIFKNSLQFNTNLFRTLLDFIIISESKIIVDPYLVSESCLSSGLVSTGTLIMEMYLMNLEDVPQAKRSRGLDTSTECIYWIKLAELYKEMNDWDVVCSIFQEKISRDDAIKKAINSESRKLWMEAQDRYRYLIENDLTVDKRDFYYEAYFKSFANLGQWKELAKAIETLETEDQNYWDVLWDDSWKQKKILPWYINAELNDMLFEGQPSKSFFENINKSLCENSKAEYLRCNFPEHLSMMWILNNDVDTSEVYVGSYLDSFLGQWQILDPMFYKLRYDKILKLRSYSNIYEIIDLYRQIGSEELDKVFGSLRFLWSNSQNETCQSLVANESRVLYHKQFANLIHSKISSLDDPEKTYWIAELENIKFKFDLGIIEAALTENNFYMARKYLKAHKNRKGIGLYMAKMMFIKAQSARNSNESLHAILKSLEIINRDVLGNNKNNDILLSTLLTSFEILEEASKLILKDNMLLEQHGAAITRVTGYNIRTSEDLPECGGKRIIDFLECYSKSGESDLDQKHIADAYVKLAYYYSEKESIDVDNLNMLVLRAMRLGSREARQLFPCLLQQESLGSAHKTVFIEESALVPTWMFLAWIPQLLANLNSEKVYAIGSIVIRIAELYPQAIMYPYRLSKENFNSNNEYFSSLIEKMDSLLLNEEVNIFLKALGNVSVPDSILKYHVRRIIKYATSEDYDEIQKMYEFIDSELFQQTPNSNDPNNFQGNAFKIIKNFNKYFKNYPVKRRKRLFKKCKKYWKQ